ncbi:acetylornithine deacetylase [Raineyella sp. W15-4]|uniref:acetylornithine deacetylase n=1 Tax=Raineyella sp. W15-4 TaxID=3081651 RepID=UPI002953CF96|nr:acetylornithine deacetylase [Raineyella sp. W15-4]WOQ18342.1 acetylornithine deacetylase [Raineyella sp. W15-4]
MTDTPMTDTRPTDDWGRLDGRAVAWLDRLLSRDTTSRLSNLPVAELIAEECRTLGIAVHLCPDATGRKANLVATLPAADGTTSGGIALSGHMDTVPVDGQDWSSDPFRPEVRDGRLHARGAADMKGFLALVTAALPRFAAARLAEPVHLVFTFDEELAGRGGRQMVDDLAALEVRPRACIVGEPTSMRVITGHKSVTIARVDVRGRHAHSSLPAAGCNAVEYAARICTAFRAITDGWRDEGPYDEDYAVPWSTGGVMTIEGGTARNIVPERCTVVLEFRTVPAVDPGDVIALLREQAAELTRQMQAEQPGTGIEVVVEDLVPTLATAQDSPATRAAIAYGGIPSDEHVTYGTDGGAFHAAGIETVICGPGDIAQAHGVDEYVEISQLEACQDFLATMLDRLSVPD